MKTLSLNLEREFDVAPEQLFNAIKEGVLFSSCGFDRETLKIDFKVGGTYWMQYEKFDPINGEFLEIVNNRKVVFTWGEMNTKVTILIEAKGKSSLLKLTHELIPDAKWSERFKGGWTYGFNTLTQKFNN